MVVQCEERLTRTFSERAENETEKTREQSCDALGVEVGTYSTRCKKRGRVEHGTRHKKQTSRPKTVRLRIAAGLHGKVARLEERGKTCWVASRITQSNTILRISVTDKGLSGFGREGYGKAEYGKTDLISSTGPVFLFGWVRKRVTIGKFVGAVRQQENVLESGWVNESVSLEAQQ